MVPLATSNRHGLIAGTTGSGKTITLMHLAAQWYTAKVPVLMVDCKGDMTRISKLASTVTLPPPTVPIGEMTPREVAGLLDASPAGHDSLAELWKQADADGRALVTLDDLSRGILWLRDTGRSPANCTGALCRAVAGLTAGGYDDVFQVPAFLPASLLRPVISLMAASKAVDRPEVYRTLLAWLISEMAQWPEVGDRVLKLVLLVDEAHLIFESRDVSSTMLRAIRVLRSRGVGVYFATQTPEDLPEALLGLLGHKIVHALRIYTPAAADRARVLARELGVAYQTLATLPTGHAATAILGADGVPAQWSGLVPADGRLFA